MDAVRQTVTPRPKPLHAMVVIAAVFVIVSAADLLAAPDRLRFERTLLTDNDEFFVASATTVLEGGLYAVAASDYRAIRLWHFNRSGQQVWTGKFELEARLTALEMLPGGETIFGTDFPGDVPKIGELTRNARIKRQWNADTRRDAKVLAISGAPDGRVIAIVSGSSAGSTVEVRRFGAGGALAWSQRVGDAIPARHLQAVAMRDDGGAFLAGLGVSSDLRSKGPWLRRVDEQGGEMWTKTYFGEHPDGEVLTVKTARGGGVLVLVRTPVKASSAVALVVMRLGADGIVQWQSPSVEIGAVAGVPGLAETPDGGAVAAGAGTFPDHAGPRTRHWLIECDPAGGIRSATVSDDAGVTMLGTRYSLAVSQDSLAVWRRDQRRSFLQLMLRADANTVSASPRWQESLGSVARYGSGFFIDGSGHVLTAHHVIEGCKSVVIGGIAFREPAKLVAEDRWNDLALLKTGSWTPGAFALLRPDEARLGETVVVFGFPLRGHISDEPAVTVGIVSRRAGVSVRGAREDRSIYQVSAEILAGSSGGPLLDTTGRVAGVVSSTAHAVTLLGIQLLASGAPMHGVGFAVSARRAAAFLYFNNVKYSTGDSTARLDVPTIAERASDFTVSVECFK